MRLFAVLLVSALPASYALSVADATQIQSLVDGSTFFRLGCLCDAAASVTCMYNLNGGAWNPFGTGATYNAADCTWSCGAWGTVSAASHSYSKGPYPQHSQISIPHIIASSSRGTLVTGKKSKSPTIPNPVFLKLEAKRQPEPTQQQLRVLVLKLLR